MDLLDTVCASGNQQLSVKHSFLEKLHKSILKMRSFIEILIVLHTYSTFQLQLRNNWEFF